MSVDILNAKIENASITMADHGCLTWYLSLNGSGWGVNIGGYVIGHGYLGAKEFKGSEKGTESLMRVMDTVGVENWEDLPGKYIRVCSEEWGSRITKFGNIIEDKWFDCRVFFSNKELEDEKK